MVVRNCANPCRRLLPAPRRARVVHRGLPPHRRMGARAVLSLVGLLALLPGCLIETPQMPQFSTRLQVPIGQERVTGFDLADSLGPLIEADSAGTGPLELRFGGDLGRVELGQLLRLDVAAIDVRSVLEAIELDGPPPDTVRIRAGDVVPFEIAPEGVLAQVDPFLFSLGPIDLGVIEEFDRISLASGELRFDLTNRLPIALSGSSSSGDAIWIRLSDISQVPRRILAIWKLDGELAPGETFTARLDLAGQAIGNRFEIMLSGGSPGSGGETVRVLPEHGLDLSLALSGLRANYFEGPLPVQRFEAGGTLDLELVATLAWAEVAQGRLAWDLTSSLPVAATVRVELPNMVVVSTGKPLAVEAHVGAGRSARVAVDLDGERLEARGGASLDWRLSVETEAAEGGVILTAQDGITAALEPASIELRAVEGVLRPTVLEVDAVRVSIDVPPEVDGAEFQTGAVAIELYNASAVAGFVDLSVVGRSGEREVVLPVRIDIPAGSPDLPAIARLELNEANSDVLELIRLRPERVEVGGLLYVGDGATTMRVNAGDSIGGSYVVVAPLRLVLQSATHTGESFELELAPDVREHIAGHLEALALAAQVENHFPVSAEVEVHFALQEENLLSADDLVLHTGRVEAGEVDPESGRVVAARVTPVRLAVVAGDIDLFTAERIHGAVVVRLFGGEQAVEFRTDDYLRFQGLATLEVGVR